MNIQDLQNEIVINILNHMAKHNQTISNIASKTTISEERLNRIFDIDSDRTITLVEVYEISKAIGLPFHKAMDIKKQ